MSFNVDSDIRAKLYKLPTSDLFKICSNAANNVNNIYITEVHLCLFIKLCGRSLEQKEWPVNVDEICFLKLWLRLLNKKQVIINKKYFINHLFDKYMMIPVQFIWLLQRADIVHLDYYCCKREYTDIPDQLLNIIHNDVNEEYFFNTKTIVNDILLEILFYNYASVHSKLETSHWQRTLLFEIFHKSISSMDSNKPNLINYLMNLHKFSQLLCSFILERFYNDLWEIMVLDQNKYSMYDAYTNQQTFTTKNVSNNFVQLFSMIFTKCKLNVLLESCASNENKANWKHILIATAVCVANIPDGPEQLNDIIEQNLSVAFKSGKKKNFLIAVLFARQACYEGRVPFTSYAEWYSKVFGSNSNFVTARNRCAFLFFIECLTHLVPYEPSHALRIHVDKSLRAPPMCQNAMIDYKNCCRSRLSETQSLPTDRANNDDDNNAFHLAK